MAAKGVGLVLSLILLPAMLVYGTVSGPASGLPLASVLEFSPAPLPTPLPTPAPVPTIPDSVAAQAAMQFASSPPAPVPAATAGPVGAIQDITMAEFIAAEEDRFFDYSFSFRFVKRGNIAYYVRFSTLYLCRGVLQTKLLDNAFVYWMYIDGRGDLWFCVRGNADITGGEILERRALYRYDRSREQFTLIKEEGQDCTFSNRFYKTFFLYLERGYLKAYNTQNGYIYLLGHTNDPAAFVSPDEKSVYYIDARERMIRVTGLGERKRRKTVLKLSAFPLGVYTFENWIIDTGKAQPVYYRFSGAGYTKAGELAPYPGRLTDVGIAVFALKNGAYVIPDPNRAAVDVYDFAAKAWSRVGGAERADSYGVGADCCWFYTCASPVSLYVIQGNSVSRFSFGGMLEGCSSIRVSGGKAYIFQYDEDWLTYMLDLSTRRVFRITD